MDHSRRACPDHPCDRCAVCRSGRCCLRDSPMPSASAVDNTTLWLFGSMLADNERAAAESAPQINQEPADPVETHQIIWVANEPQNADPAPAADQVIRERERRIRERWTEERPARARVDVHHHVHQEPMRDGPADDEIIDAEVIDVDDAPSAVGPAPQRALPQSPPPHSFEKGLSQEVRRDDR